MKKKSSRFLAVGVGSVLAVVAATAQPLAAHADDAPSARELRWRADQALNPTASASSIDTTATAVQLAEAMAVDPAVITGASFVTKPPSGTPYGVADTATSMGGFPLHGDTYAIMTSGDANLGPTSNSSGSSGANDGGGNYRGNTDYDVTVLRVDITVPSDGNCLSVGYFKFLSEEFPEYVGTAYNDAFIAELDFHTWTTSGSVISAPNNFAFDQAGDVISINSTGSTSMTTGDAAGTTYDGATQTLIASTPITGGAHSIYFSIFDQGDQIFDSAVFLDNLEIKSVTPGSCVSGATAPITTTKTADAPYASPGGQDGYTITLHNPNTTAIQVSSIYDDLPAGFSYLPSSTSGVSTSNPSITGQHLEWSGPFTVPPNGVAALHFLVSVSTTLGTYYNDAGGIAGGANVTPVLNTAPITVNQGTRLDAYPATVDVDVITTSYNYHLRAKLTTTTGTAIVGKTLVFTNSGTVDNGTVICTAVTNGIGEGTCDGTAHSASINANLGYTAVFAGDSSYGGTSDHGALSRYYGTELPA